MAKTKNNKRKKRSPSKQPRMRQNLEKATNPFSKMLDEISGMDICGLRRSPDNCDNISIQKSAIPSQSENIKSEVIEVTFTGCDQFEAPFLADCACVFPEKQSKYYKKEKSRIFEKETEEKDAMIKRYEKILNDYVKDNFARRSYVYAKNSESAEKFLDDMCFMITSNNPSKPPVSRKSIKRFINDDPDMLKMYKEAHYVQKYRDVDLLDFLVYSTKTMAFGVNFCATSDMCQNIDIEAKGYMTSINRLIKKAEKANPILPHQILYQYHYHVQKQVLNDYEGDEVFLSFYKSVCECLKNKERNLMMMSASIQKALEDRMRKYIFSLGDNYDYNIQLNLNKIDLVETANAGDLADFLQAIFETFCVNTFQLAEEGIVKRYRYLEIDPTKSKKNKAEMEQLKQNNININKSLEEANDRIKTLNQKCSDLSQKNTDILQKQDSMIKKAVKAANDDYYTLNREFKKIKAENEKLKQANKDNFKENIESKETSEPENVKFNIISYLKIRDKRIVFVRDYEYDGLSLCRQIEKAFPNSRITDSISNEVNSNSTDLVVLLTRYEKHGSYWGARDKAKQQDVPVIHCHATNIDVISQLIYEKTEGII